MAALAKDIDAILDRPLTAAQETLAQILLAQRMSESERDAIVRDIKDNASFSLRHQLDVEEHNILHALQTGSFLSEPDFSSEEMQLLWGAYLTHVSVNSPDFAKSDLWQALQSCDAANDQRRRHAMFLARDQFNPKTRLEWGLPGSMFYFDPSRNAINIDLVMSLVLGFDNTRSIIFHEIGHSKLTVKFPPEMQTIYDQMEALQRKGEDGTITQDEYATLKGLAIEWKFRHRVFDEAENSPVNRYTINLAPKLTPDPEEALDRALNIVETTVAEAAHHALPQDPPDAMRKFQNFTRIVRMGLYKNNGLFENTPAGWARMGVRTDWVEALPRHQNDAAPSAQEAFDELLELCGGPYGLENLQPTTLDRARGAAWLAQKTDLCADQRNEIIEKHLWKRYAEPLLRPMIEQAKAQAKQQAQQQAQANPQNSNSQSQKGVPSPGASGQPQQGQGAPSGQGASGSGQGGGSQPDENQPGDTGSGQGSSSEGQNQGAGSASDQTNQDSASAGKAGKEAGDKQSVENSAGQGADANEDGDKTPAEKGGGQSGESAEQDADPAPGEDQGAPVEVQGAGKMPGIRVPSKKPAQERANQASQQTGKSGNETGQDAAQQGNDSDSIEALLEEMDQAASSPDENKQEAAQQAAQPQGGKGGGKGAGRSSGVFLPKKGKWEDYQKTANANLPQIIQAERLLQQTREKQSKRWRQKTDQYELVPEDGKMERFSVQRHVDLVVKMAMGRSVNEQDAKRFRIDEERKTPAEIDVVVMVDGSASMYWKSGNEWNAAPIDAGIQTACILNEGTRRLNRREKRTSHDTGINYTAVVWGNDPPLVLTKPGDEAQKTGIAIAGLKESHGWGTSLAPAIAHITAMQAERKDDPHKPVGFTHFITISDGDIGDPRESLEALEKVMEHSPLTTFDVIVISGSRYDTQMENVVADMQKRHGESRVKLVKCSDPELAHASVLTLLRERMLATGHTQAVTFRERARSLQNAARSMEF